MTDADRAEVIKQIRAREAKQYNAFGVLIRQQIVPTCGNCESNFHGKCAAADMWDTPPDYEAHAITDEESVCKYWTPSCNAYFYAEKQAEKIIKRRRKNGH